jgi:hypothetical protein
MKDTIVPYLIRIFKHRSADGKIMTQLYDKRDISSAVSSNSLNIPLPPAWFVYISQLIQNAEVCSKYDQFLYAR